MPAIIPMIGDAHKGTNPAQGVIVASPAILPVKTPTSFGLRLLIHSITNQVTRAKEAAISVLRKAVAVTESTFNSLPALKPYQPNQRSPLPIATRGILLGVEFLSTLAPTKNTEARAAKPANV